MFRLLIFILFFPSVIFAKSYSINFNFMAKTNVPGVKIKGKLINKIKSNLTPESNITISINNLTTELSLRDEHMRSDVFQNKDIMVKLLSVKCSESNCTYGIDLKIVDVSNNMQLIAKKVDAKKYEGTFDIKMSDFKIPEQSKMGVKVLDKINLNFEIEENDEK